jgi:predicted nuclease with TOPRIM domain
VYILYSYIYFCVLFDIRSELDRAQDDKDTLLKKLVETEMDGKAASEQVMKLRETARKLKQVRRRTEPFLQQQPHFLVEQVLLLTDD